MPSFGEYAFELGTKYRTKPPYLYGSYQVYQADRAS